MEARLPSAADRAEARIKQLCGLGLGGQAIVPALLNALHLLVPSYSNAFYWTDEHCRVTNLYFEDPSTVAWLYLSDFYNRRRLVADSTRPTHPDPVPVVVTRQPDASDFYTLDLNAPIYGPLDRYQFMRVLVSDAHRALGTLQLCRLKGEVTFSAGDEKRVATVAPYIAHGLTAQVNGQIPLAESEERGFLLIDLDGRLRLSSPLGRKLLFLAAHPSISPTTVRRSPGAAAPAEVAQLGERLAGAFAGKGQNVQHAVWRERNTWGGFGFHAYRLDEGNPWYAQIGVIVQHHEPLAIKLWRNLENLPLSKRQTAVCLLMASGLSYAAIARRLEIAESTAIDHARHLYDKLDVHNRTELMNKLLAS
jgi:DNA-binding CsgD family transcriptional regulator